MRWLFVSVVISVLAACGSARRVSSYSDSRASFSRAVFDSISVAWEFPSWVPCSAAAGFPGLSLLPVVDSLPPAGRLLVVRSSGGLVVASGQDSVVQHRERKVRATGVSEGLQLLEWLLVCFVVFFFLVFALRRL